MEVSIEPSVHPLGREPGVQNYKEIDENENPKEAQVCERQGTKDT